MRYRDARDAQLRDARNRAPPLLLRAETKEGEPSFGGGAQLVASFSSWLTAATGHWPPFISRSAHGNVRAPLLTSTRLRVARMGGGVSTRSAANAAAAALGAALEKWP